MRRSLLELQTQIETLRGEIARLHGQNEQLLRDLAESSAGRRTSCRAWTSGCARSSLPRSRWTARNSSPTRPRRASSRPRWRSSARANFPAAQAAFAEFIKRYPQSGFRPTALFWLGNSQYANRDYRGAITNFRALLAAAPEHPRAAEAVLSIANCQIELKDNAGARRTLDELVKAYPQSEAARGRQGTAGPLPLASRPLESAVTHLDEAADLQRRFGGAGAPVRHHGRGGDPRRPCGGGRHRRRRLLGRRGAGPQRRRRTDPDRPGPCRRIQHQPADPGAGQHPRPGQGAGHARAHRADQSRLHRARHRGIRRARTTGRSCCRRASTP